MTHPILLPPPSRYVTTPTDPSFICSNMLSFLTLTTFPLSIIWTSVSTLFSQLSHSLSLFSRSRDWCRASWRMRSRFWSSASKALYVSLMSSGKQRSHQFLSVGVSQFWTALQNNDWSMTYLELITFHIFVFSVLFCSPNKNAWKPQVFLSGKNVHVRNS